MNNIDITDNRKIDEYGNVVFNTQGVLDALLSGVDITSLISEDNKDSELYQTMVKFRCSDEEAKTYNLPIYSKPDISVEDFDKQNQQEWFIPDSYKELDLYEKLLTPDHTAEELLRIEFELKIFEKYKMLNLLRTMIFLVDIFRKFNVVYGVGRGSSVASYVLYLIGIHRINSIKYNLDFSEFLE